MNILTLSPLGCRQIANVVEKTNISTVHVASDHNPMIKAIQNHLGSQVQYIYTIIISETNLLIYL